MRSKGFLFPFSIQASNRYMLQITWHSKQIQIRIKNSCKYAGKKITLLENGQDISSKNRQELQTPSMIIKPFKKNIIRRLKSLSQVFLNLIESRKQHTPIINITRFTFITWKSKHQYPSISEKHPNKPQH
jgi:TRAP-type mannitol/chloroaromatic compound transport system substrate-binding protein